MGGFLKYQGGGMRLAAFALAAKIRQRFYSGETSANTTQRPMSRTFRVETNYENECIIEIIKLPLISWRASRAEKFRIV